MQAGAILSDDGKYRYLLTRTWDESKPRLGWIMLNPSTADASENDPTIRVCCGRAKRMHMGGIIVANLFALRATDPGFLFDSGPPICGIGEVETYWHGIVMAARAFMVIFAWGSHGRHQRRDEAVLDYLCERGLENGYALKVNRDGTPAHPLRIPYSAQPQRYFSGAIVASAR